MTHAREATTPASRRDSLPNLNSHPLLLLLAFCAAQFAALALWLRFKLADFYYYRGDDVGRLLRALHWTRHPTFMPFDDRLPFTTYLFGGLIAVFRDTYVTPLILQALLIAGILGLIGLISVRLTKDAPLLALLPMAAATQLPLFERLGLSAGAEVSLWLFLLLSAWLWLLYLEKEQPIYALLGAACLCAASMTRYEAWLSIAAFLPIAGQTFYKRKSFQLGLACFLLSIAYIAFFISYQESHLIRVSPDLFRGLPLSYRGIRLYFQQPNPGVVRSFAAPLRAWFELSPLLAAVEAATLTVILARRPALRWYAAWWGVSFALLSLEGGVFGISTDAGRLLLYFHLVLLPVACCVLAGLLPAPSSAGWLLVPLLSLILLPRTLPKLRDSEALLTPGAGDSYVIAKAVHEEEAQAGLKPQMLVELRVGPGAIIWDATPLRFGALDRFIEDRNAQYDLKDESLLTRDNPSVFSLPRKKLELYLKDRSAGWIVVWSPAATAALAGLAQPVATVGSRTLFAYGLTEDSIRRCRERIRSASVN